MGESPAPRGKVGGGASREEDWECMEEEVKEYYDEVGASMRRSPGRGSGETTVLISPILRLFGSRKKPKVGCRNTNYML